MKARKGGSPGLSVTVLCEGSHDLDPDGEGEGEGEGGPLTPKVAVNPWGATFDSDVGVGEFGSLREDGDAETEEKELSEGDNDAGSPSTEPLN